MIQTEGIAAFFAVFDDAPDDTKALFAGHLAFVVGRGANLGALRPEFAAPLARFAELINLDDALSPTATAEAIDAFFADTTVDSGLARAFETFVQQHALNGQAARGELAPAAEALLGTTTSKIPVGTTRVAGAVPGGTLGLLQARLAQNTRPT